MREILNLNHFSADSVGGASSVSSVKPSQKPKITKDEVSGPGLVYSLLFDEPMPTKKESNQNFHEEGKNNDGFHMTSFVRNQLSCMKLSLEAQMVKMKKLQEEEKEFLNSLLQVNILYIVKFLERDLNFI